MGKYVLTDCKLLLGAYDLSGDMREVKIDHKAAVKDATTFGNTARRKLAGVTESSITATGLWEAGVGEVDPVLHSKLALADEILTVCPQTGAIGERAFTTKVIEARYSPAGRHGELFAFNVTADGTGPLVASTVLGVGTKTATASGTGYQLGAITATQTLYAVMHITAASGTLPTLGVVIASDDNDLFTSAVTRATFAQAVTIGAQWVTAAGPVTDDWWRATWTIGGTTPSFTVHILMGIM